MATTNFTSIMDLAARVTHKTVFVITTSARSKSFGIFTTTTHNNTLQLTAAMNFITLYATVVTAILAMLLVPPSQQVIRHFAIQNVMPLRANHIPSFLLAVPRLQMLRVVVEAGVFEHINNHGPMKVSKLASDLNLHEDTLHMYLSNCAFMELIQAKKSGGDEVVSC